MLGKIEGRSRRWLEDITDAVEVNLDKPQEMVRDRVLPWEFTGSCMALRWGQEKILRNWTGDVVLQSVNHIFAKQVLTKCLLSLREAAANI